MLKVASVVFVPAKKQVYPLNRKGITMTLPASPSQYGIALKILLVLFSVAMSVLAAAILARFAPAVFLFLAVGAFRLFVLALFAAVLYLIARPFVDYL